MDVTERLRPLARWDLARGPPIRAVFTDVDDTLTDAGLLSGAAYQALWDLHDAGIAVVAVTGRPAGWCDLIARQWPVAGVVGENGALALARDPKKLWQRTAAGLEAAPQRLQELAEAILREVPRARLAADQPHRRFDLAIDFAEDEPKLSPDEVAQIVQVFHRHGARAKISSIHVNGWFGDHDKLSMIRRFAEERLDLDLTGPDGRRCVYVGDSPNDAPAFAAFDLSVGVANVRDFKDALDPPPRYVTDRPRGGGFVEFAQHVLAGSRNMRQPGSAP
ncbi:MAG TPA: HAD-IIB family hydrolase [Myxococcales bacterium LLY-WYZ-16_1]|nr:HAD-IIB family hydrolase [Myxococcales bacterium LLY-WYZ-16_1]